MKRDVLYESNELLVKNMTTDEMSDWKKTLVEAGILIGKAEAAFVRKVDLDPPLGVLGIMQEISDLKEAMDSLHWAIDVELGIKKPITEERKR